MWYAAANGHLPVLRLLTGKYGRSSSVDERSDVRTLIKYIIIVEQQEVCMLSAYTPCFSVLCFAIVFCAMN